MFREKYRRDNELLTAPEKIPERILTMMKKKEKGKHIGWKIAAAAVACLVVCTAAVLPFVLGGGAPDQPQPVVVSLGDLRIAGDYEEIFEAIESNREYHYYAGLGSVMTDGAAVEEAETEMPTGSAAMDDKLSVNYNGASEYSETNTQVENVDEGDIIKTDGRFVYRMTDREIIIADALEMTVVSRISLDAYLGNLDSEELKSDYWLQEMYVSGDRLAVLFSKYEYSAESWWVNTMSGVAIFDITDRAQPTFVSDFAQSGDTNTSRMIGDYIYLVSNYYIYGETDEQEPATYIPMIEYNGEESLIPSGCICILPNTTSSSYLVISSVSIADASSPCSTQAVLGYSGNVYADTETIILSYRSDVAETVETQENGEDVVITTNDCVTNLVSYSVSDGIITPTATGSVPGYLLNQFSIDRYNGMVRLVTTSNRWTYKVFTEGIDRYESENEQTNGLYVLDSSLNVIGKLDGLAEDERVYSVRFSGDIGYFVTFRETDPLFAVDLSDPTAPTLLSALKIPGFSQYLHPYADGLLLGIGRDADEKTGSAGGLKLSMFDISDPANVTERHTTILEDVHYSDVLYNHKAAVISAARDIIAFPVSYDSFGYLIFGYGEDGFYKRFELDLGDGDFSTARGLYIGDSFYVCSNQGLWRYDMQTFTLQQSLSFEA